MTNLDYTSQTHKDFNPCDWVTFVHLPEKVNGKPNPLIGRTGMVVHSQKDDVLVAVKGLGEIGFRPVNLRLVSRAKIYHIFRFEDQECTNSYTHKVLGSENSEDVIDYLFNREKRNAKRACPQARDKCVSIHQEAPSRVPGMVTVRFFVRVFDPALGETNQVERTAEYKIVQIAG